MGIHDRDYYRDDGGRWGRASEHRGVIALIAVTVACTVVNWVAPHVPRNVTLPNGEVIEGQVSALEEVAEYHHPKVIPGGQVWRFATSFWINAHVVGLIFGMLGLYFFGGEMEILYGTGRFVGFYLLTGLLGNVVKFLLALGGVGVDAHTSGAAGPLFATFVLFAFHYPHRPIRFWFLLPIPVWILVVIYLGLSLLSLAASAQTPGGSGIPGVIEPLVGAAVGFLYYRTRGRLFGFLEVFTRRRRRSPANLRAYDDDAPRPAPRPSGRPSSPPPPAVPQPAGAGVDEHLEAKLDAVLAKVARHGKGSLTAEENDILLRASEVFRKKRG